MKLYESIHTDWICYGAALKTMGQYNVIYGITSGILEFKRIDGYGYVRINKNWAN